MSKLNDSFQRLPRGFCWIGLAWGFLTIDAGAATIDVQVDDFSFTPATVEAKIGDTVRWTWVRGAHSVTSGSACTPDGQWDSGIKTAGFTSSFTFTKAGSYPYFCKPHCTIGMTGVVNVDTAPTGGLADPIPQPIAAGTIEVNLTSVASGLTAPNWGTFAPGDGQRLFVTDQVGTLWAIDLATGSKRVFGDLSALLIPLGIDGPGTYDERGLLGLAFHPDYAGNGLLYTFTSEPVDGAADFSTLPPGIAADHQSVVREWKVPAPRDTTASIDPASARVLFRIDKPQFNHNGGGLAFGKDGFIYISTGDGGAADDQGDGHSAQGNGQDLSNVLGKILRIDPTRRSAANGRYGVPLTNPFVAKQAGVRGGAQGCADGKCDEIYAYGLRNPFRFSFDLIRGTLYAGDVGQNDIEEVDVIKAGGNYGWRIKEGTFCFDANGTGDGFVTADTSCASSELIDPIAQYDHDEGHAVIGGFLYRGGAISPLRGHYVFGDYARTFNNDGRLFYLADKNGVPSYPLELQLKGKTGLGLSLLGFGQDARGELYVLGNATGVPSGTTGVVMKITP